jgi:hypothetical protein
MSAELRDFRGKVTAETDMALEAMSRAFKRDKSDIAREVLHAWALKKIMEANVLARMMRSEGMEGNQQGVAGSDEL